MDRYALYMVHSTLLQLTVLNIRNRARDRSSDSFFERVKALLLSTAHTEYQATRQKVIMHPDVIYYLKRTLLFLHVINKNFNWGTATYIYWLKEISRKLFIILQ